MKMIIQILCFCVLCIAAHAQKESNIWIFADSCGMDFNSPTNTPTFFFSKNTKASVAGENFNAMSDSNGNLLFYIGYDAQRGGQGGIIYSKDSTEMDNGFWNGPNASTTNGSSIIPAPLEPDNYYIFYWYPLGLYYHKIDMTKNGGAGKVIVNGASLESQNTSLTEQVIAIQHANGNDWWILTHEVFSNRFCRRLITETGIDTPKYQRVGYRRNYGLNSIGEFALGPKSESFAIVTFHGHIEWYKFDRCSGLLSSRIDIGEPSPIPAPDDRPLAYGCSISPSGRFLYVSSALELFQYDLKANNVKASKVLIWTNGNTLTHIGQHQLGPNGKIYISTMHLRRQFSTINTALSVIHEPNKKGSACEFRPADYFLQGQRSSLGLPSPPHYGLGPLPLPKASAGPDLHHSCPLDSSRLGSPAHPDYLYSWEPKTGLSDPNIAQPTASPKTSTTYILTVFDTQHACRNVNTDTVTVIVENKGPSLSVDAGSDLAVACPGDKIKIGLPPQPGWWYRWESDTIVSTDPQPEIQVDQPAWYYLIAGNDPENPCEYGIDSIWVDIEAPPLPEADAGADRTICPGGGTWLEVREYPNQKYYWRPDSLFADPTLARQWLRPQYPLKVVLQVTDISRDCHNIAYDTLHLKVEQIPYADAGSDMWLCQNLDMSDTIGTTPLPHAQYLWEPANGLSDPFAAQPLVYTGADRIYHLTVVKDTFCVSSDSLHVLHKACDTPYFPNAFSPNGDGINDVFRITNLPGGCVFRVWNRWGRVLFESENYGNDWDGKNAPEGVYMYRLVEPDGTQHAGSVTVIR